MSDHAQTHIITSTARRRPPVSAGLRLTARLRRSPMTQRLAALVFLAASLTPAGTPALARTAKPVSDAQFVYETMAPTPKADPAEVWRTGTLAHTGFQACGTYPFQIRLAVPKKVGRFVLNLRRNVLAWGGNGSNYRLVIRTGSPTGAIAYTQEGSLGYVNADITAGVKRFLKRGYVDLYPTIECTGDGWTYYPDSDWGGWDIEAYNIATKTHRLGLASGSVSTWYQNHLDRLDDLKKYDLVILGAVYPANAGPIGQLKAAGTTVAGYVSFGEDPRPDGTPLVGDGRGPGGYDSRYVDFKSADGSKAPDGYPDFKPYGTGRNFFTDPRSASWQQVILQKVAAQMAAGTDAVFFDTFYVTHPSLVDGIRPLLLALQAAHPGVKLIVNSYDQYKEVGGIVHAVMFESYTYKPGGVRVLDTEIPPRNSQAATANLLRGGTTNPTFDVFTLDYVEPYGDGSRFEDAYARAEANGITASFYQMTVVNPANGLLAAPAGGGFSLSWSAYSTTPAPETMADVGTYEIRRSATPFTTDAQWDAATVVATGLGAGTRSFTDPSPPPDGLVYYALRALRDGSGRQLLGTVTVQAR